MKYIIAVASGKGGVGKSTVAVNLSLALAMMKDSNDQPLKVALVDADVYGPSVPMLMGVRAFSEPCWGGVCQDEDGKIVPLEKFGIKFLSIAFFLRSDDDPVIWRGPMASKAVSQLFEQTQWGEIDVCVVDLPPGTGDISLSMAQSVGLNGVVFVTTPQEVALIDVKKSINMFKKLEVPILGIVENMAGFIAEDGKRYDIFGAGGAGLISSEYNIETFVSIPIDIDIRKSCDAGVPCVTNPHHPQCTIFKLLAERVLTNLKTVNDDQPTKFDDAKNLKKERKLRVI